jgi:hypothetical protein
LVTRAHFKDERLNELREKGNIAQFASFSPNLAIRFSSVNGIPPNHAFGSVEAALSALLEASAEHRLNVRSFRPDDPQGNEFVYGISSAKEVEQHIRRLAANGMYSIANETIDINDGGVSGVAHGGVIEFGPGSTPRIVETGEVASFSRLVGEHLLRIVYGVVPDIPLGPDVRVEFSVHPQPRGFRNQQTIIWEIQESPGAALRPNLRWPNLFSQFIGDKTFGLLLAECLGFRVPSTTVISRYIAPFAFGSKTGSTVKWLRTAPRIAEPGYFPTVRGWQDPFKLMEKTENRDRVAAVLVQDEVESRFSGALLTSSSGEAIIEGVEGFGDEFMLGRVGAASLEKTLNAALNDLHNELVSKIGAVRAEWAFDGKDLWLLQLQQETAVSSGMQIVPGDFEEELDFDLAGGIAGLRELVAPVRDRNIGIVLHGNVGMTSHIADILRRNSIPSRIQWSSHP